MEMRQGGLGPVLVVAAEGWHQGVIGIVASRLKDKFRRPSLVITTENGVGKGSGRSVPGADLGRAVFGRGGGGDHPEGRRSRHGGGPRSRGRADRGFDRLPRREARPRGSDSTASGIRSGLDGAVETRGATPDLVRSSGAGRALWQRKCRAALRGAPRQSREGGYRRRRSRSLHSRGRGWRTPEGHRLPFRRHAARARRCSIITAASSISPAGSASIAGRAAKTFSS